MQIQANIKALRASRVKHAVALRASRRAGADMLRAALAVAQPMLAAEAVQMHKARAPGEDYQDPYRDFGRAVLILDRSEYERHQVGHDEWETRQGWQLWARGDGTLIEARADHSCQRWEDWHCTLLDARPIGLREAVRRYGAGEIVAELSQWAIGAAKGHDDAAAREHDAAAKFRAALAALKP